MLHKCSLVSLIGIPAPHSISRVNKISVSTIMLWKQLGEGKLFASIREITHFSCREPRLWRVEPASLRPRSPIPGCRAFLSSFFPGARARDGAGSGCVAWAAPARVNRCQHSARRCEPPSTSVGPFCYWAMIKLAGFLWLGPQSGSSCFTDMEKELWLSDPDLLSVTVNCGLNPSTMTGTPSGVKVSRILKQEILRHFPSS